MNKKKLDIIAYDPHENDNGFTFTKLFTRKDKTDVEKFYDEIFNKNKGVEKMDDIINTSDDKLVIRLLLAMYSDLKTKASFKNVQIFLTATKILTKENIKKSINNSEYFEELHITTKHYTKIANFFICVHELIEEKL